MSKLDEKLWKMQADGWDYCGSQRSADLLLAALRRARDQRDFFISELMNTELNMPQETKHVVPKFDADLLAILEGGGECG